jgi:hypothetical protein
MTTFATIDGKLWHCGQMARKLRHAHAAAATCIGLDAHSGISEMFQASGWRRAWLIDGELAALGGVVGPMLASDGFVWLALAETTGHYPIAIVREARRQLADLMMFKRCLTTTILPGDPASQRLAIFLGFHVCGELAQPPFPATTRLGRRTIARYIEGTPECRVPIRGGYGVQLIYHGAIE